MHPGIFPYLVLIFAFTTTFSQAGDNIIFTTDNGLPDNNVTCMLTDKQGFVWVGTFNGLCRFDGTNFYNFPKGTVEGNKMAGDIILDLEEDGDFIWVAHRFGLSQINKYSFESRNFQNNEPGQVYNLRRAVRDIYKDKAGNLWLAGDHQLLRFDKKRNSILTVADFEKIFDDGRPTQVNKIISAGNNQLFLFMVRHWLRYDISKNKLDTLPIRFIPVKMLQGENLRLRSYWNTFVSNFFVHFDKGSQSVSVSNQEMPGNVGRALNLYVDSNCQIFVNREQNEVTVFNPELFALKNGSNVPPGNISQPFNFIHFSNGAYCSGSVKGLNITDSRNRYMRKFYFNKVTNGILPAVPDILDIKEYTDNNWLIATKGGLYKFNRLSNSVLVYSRWKDSTIYKMLIMPDKTVWFSTDDKLWHYDLEKDKIKRSVAIETYATSIGSDNGRLIVGTRSDGAVLVDPKPGGETRIRKDNNPKLISSNRITAIKPIDDHGTFLITFNDMPGQYSFSNFTTGFFNADSIPTRAYSLGERFSLEACFSGKGQLWFGNYIGGANLYDSSLGTWTNLTMNNGMGNNTVFDILSDLQNRVWLLTDNGIDVYDNATRQVYNFPVKFLTGGRKGGFKSTSGKLVFFDKESIVEIQTDAINFQSANSRILFSGIDQNGNFFLQRGNKLNLPYDQNSFSIHFSLQKIDVDYDTRYAYRLSARDEWKEIGKETELNFVRLKPGKYNLEIRGTDEFGHWGYYSPVLSIRIAHPFWESWWFILATGAACFASLRYLLNLRQKRRIRHLQQQNEILRLRAEKELGIMRERERIITDLHDDVGATLSSLSIYGDVADKLWSENPMESKRLIGKISLTASDLMGRMGDIIWSMKAGNEERYTLEARLKNHINELLSPKNITCDFTIDPKIAISINSPDSRKNILLIAKEAINNIAKYSNATHASLSFVQQDEAVILCIADNGIGFQPEVIKAGNGLQHLQRRCHQLGGQFSLQSGPGKGTSVVCTFPINVFGQTAGM